MCVALGENIFTYGKKGSADAVPRTLKACIKHVGTIMGSDNASELANRKEFKPKEPEFTQAQKDEHADEELKRKQRGERMITAWQSKLRVLEQRNESQRTLDTPIKIAE